MRDRGITRGDRIAILSANSIEWEEVQMSAFACGAVVVSIDLNSNDDQIQALLEKTNVVAIFAQDLATYRRLGSNVADRLKLVCIFGLEPNIDVPHVHSIDDVRAKDQDTRTARASCNADDSAIIVFSSGTTGTPKPIAYTHRQLMLAVQAIVRAYPDINQSSRMICWLPLANLFQRVVNFFSTVVGAQTFVLADPRRVIDVMPIVNPAVVVGVPRFFERVRANIVARLAEQRGAKGKIARWALNVALSSAESDSRRVQLQSRLRWRIADRLVLRRLRSVFGGNIKYLVSGSAPLQPQVHTFFDGIGLPIFEAYGLSENIVPIAMNHPTSRRRGSVGKPVSGNDVRVSSENEIEVAGAGVFSGYLDGHDSAARFSSDGYLRTGDLGRFDQDGFLYIDGRAADWFKLSTGRWISPATIEHQMSTLPYIENVLVLGENQKAIIAFITLLADYKSKVNAEQIAMDVKSALASLPDYQQPASIVVLRDAFSVARGELTTNLKVRRNAIRERYSNIIEQTYAKLETRRERNSIPVQYL